MIVWPSSVAAALQDPMSVEYTTCSCLVVNLSDVATPVPPLSDDDREQHVSIFGIYSHP